MGAQDGRRRLPRRKRAFSQEGHHRANSSRAGHPNRQAVFICRQAADFGIGVGLCNVQRALVARSDRRIRGRRVPNGHVSVSSRRPARRTQHPEARCDKFQQRRPGQS
eukprot:11195944-Lingulodinium_polyedra.AAC.1